jgi:putative peptidoglycan lipid II flippase
VPSAVAFLALGDVVAAALLQTGRFGPSDALYVWGILAGSAVGLLASTLGRLYSSAYYALRDTRTPLKYAVTRVSLTTILGYTFAVVFPGLLGVAAIWGAVGITLAGGIAAWVEMLMLRRTLNTRVGTTGLPAAFAARLWTAAATGAAVGWGVKQMLPAWHPALTAIPVLGSYGTVFLITTALLRVPEASSILTRMAQRRDG